MSAFDELIAKAEGQRIPGANRPQEPLVTGPQDVAREAVADQESSGPGRESADEGVNTLVSGTAQDVESSGARGYSWPPFEPGHTLSVRHGTYSNRAVAARAAEVHASLLEVAPWCAEDHYLPSVNRYLQATARETLAHEALMAGGKLSPRLLETATAAARLAWAMGDALGLTPAGHARLKLLVAGATHAEADLADLAAQGRAIIDGTADDRDGGE